MMQAAESRAPGPRTTPGLAPLASCPECDGGEFVVEEIEDLVVFRCRTCDRSWHYELGYVWPCGSR